MQYPHKKFFLALTAGRAARFCVEAYLGRAYGQQVIGFFSHNYYPMMYLLIALAITAGIGAVIYFKW